MSENLTHEFKPVYNKDSIILILGTFPSVKSRECNFYYGHPQNRFWKVLATIFEENIPETVEEKKSFLLKNKVAIWDVIQSCTIKGSSDSSIKDVIPSDITEILKNADIKCIYGNGAKACELYKKYIFPVTNREIVKLPSTSPANAAWNMERLIEQWKVIRI